MRQRPPDPSADGNSEPEVGVGEEVWRAGPDRVVVHGRPDSLDTYGAENTTARDIQIDAPTHHGPLDQER
jgi:hypothetical protein